MFVKLITLLVMEVWACLAATQHLRHWQQAEVPCTIGSALDTPLISAHLERPVAATGCTANNSATETRTEVHVIRYHGEAKENLELTIEDMTKSDFEFPMVIVLVSDVKVYWHVRILRQPEHLRKHTFVVSHGSGFRFANKKMVTKPTIQKPRRLPYDIDQLATWLKMKFPVLTSFTTLDGGHSIRLEVGKASSLPEAISDTPCDVNRADNTALSAGATMALKQSINGCLLPHRFSSQSKLVYVVELGNVGTLEPYLVSLEVTLETPPIPKGRRPRSRKPESGRVFWLVLKSPPNVEWHVHSKQKDEFIMIVANSDVDMSGLEMDVGVRSELLEESGHDLLRWVEYYLGPIAMYAAVNNSNHIQISVPHSDEKPKLTPRHIQEVLRGAMTVSCDTSSLTVALPRKLLETVHVEVGDLSLLDKGCRAERNLSHAFIQSDPRGCSTQMSLSDGMQTYINALIVQMDDLLSESLDGLVGSGLEDIISGSGLGDWTGIDDEDIVPGHLTLEFSCITSPVAVHVPTMQAELMYKIHLYPNDKFMRPEENFPYTVTTVDTPLYVQALATADPRLRAHMYSCWLAPPNSADDSKNHYLVKNGCEKDRSVQYEDNSIPQSERLQFTMEEYVHHGWGNQAQLTCELTLCCIGKDCTPFSYPQCPNYKTLWCELPRFGVAESDLPATIVSLGPLNLPEAPKTYHESDEEGVEMKPEVSTETPSVSGGNKGSPMVIEGLDSGTVVGIAFAAFIIGALMMGSLWFIHSHSGSLFSSSPFKRNASTTQEPPIENEEVYVESTPGSSVPIST
ncbi:uncharacterized protein LOC128224280 [Mya arenaria]|uniref:uncharacterized protein LOC128224280 n=1 Tax=Mya arenaria TaxID=6604 RepID=UPI0022E03D44|nr:uncharacterized protein LOC128224280 [Mya arenaria]